PLGDGGAGEEEELDAPPRRLPDRGARPRRPRSRRLAPRPLAPRRGRGRRDQDLTLSAGAAEVEDLVALERRRTARRVDAGARERRTERVALEPPEGVLRLPGV